MFIYQYGSSGRQRVRVIFCSMHIPYILPGSGHKSEIMSFLMLGDLLTSEQHMLQKIRRSAIAGWRLGTQPRCQTSYADGGLFTL